MKVLQQPKLELKQLLKYGLGGWLYSILLILSKGIYDLSIIQNELFMLSILLLPASYFLLKDIYYITKKQDNTYIREIIKEDSIIHHFFIGLITATIVIPLIAIMLN